MVSVIITTYGGGKRLKRAIDSVLNQTYQDIEVIVVDDNPTESKERIATSMIMKDYLNDSRVLYIKHPQNMNGAAARNTGIKHSKGEYISFLDDDDFYIKNRIEKLLECIDDNKNIGGICSGVLYINDGFIYSFYSPEGKFLKTKNLFLHQSELGTGSNIFLRKNIVDECGYFDVSFNRYQDVEYMIRASKITNILVIDDPLVVKDISDSRAPSYIKIKASLDIFCNKFSKDLKSFNDEEKQIFWIDRYSMLFDICKYEMDESNLKDVAKELSKYRMLTNKENEILKNYNFFIIFVKTKLFLKHKFLFVLRILKRIKYKKIHKHYIEMYDLEKEIAS